ncbi:SGS3 [Hibiscus syriacus]|uniref:SGS3 n=1 Tax=Hibiscus syriacus TaxID=106335 RepID=A0A6A2YFU1_HIBSY|nr:SGS3 [Hibiscus syriacus]
MSSRKGNRNPSSKGKEVTGFSGSKFEQLSRGIEDMNLGLPQDDGDWEVIKRKSKNKAGSSAARPWGTQNSNSNSRGSLWTNAGSGRTSGNAWATHKTDSRTANGRGNARPQTFNKTSENNNVPPNGPNPVIRPPLQYGWNWQSRAGSNPSEGSQDVSGKDIVSPEVEEDNDIDDDLDDNAIDDSDDELLTDDFDSDSSQKSHDTRKNNRWFKKFFSSLDALSIEEINDPARQWHCPACQGGPGAIDWGTSVVPAGEAFGKWKGLKDEEKDHEIVWPPMVIIMNTRLEQDENDKWIGMGNQELLDYFSSYAAVRARHSYGPQGHRGMSILIFESTARGYLEAERLHKHFDEQGTHREAWDRRRVLFYPGGKRQLYGYMAIKEDLDSFNQHSQGKSRLKFEMRSYQEMVVNQIRQMSEDNQQLIFYKNKVAKEQRQKNELEKNFGIVTEKLRKTMEETRIVRQRTKMQHEQNKEEMDYQEQFFQEQIKFIHEARDEKEERFEKLQQQQRENVKLSNPNPSNTQEYKRRADEIAKFIKFQDEEMQAYVDERDKLIKAHEEKMAALRQKHRQEEVELEKEFVSELSQLMEKYTPDGSKVGTDNA